MLPCREDGLTGDDDSLDGDDERASPGRSGLGGAVRLCGMPMYSSATAMRLAMACSRRTDISSSLTPGRMESSLLKLKGEEI